MRIAIVGAGIAGLSAADILAERGHAVSLFDKGRAPGGRMSTRQVEVDGRTLCFDHGAQYFTARDPAFVECVAAWERDGLAARWPATGPSSFVGVPGMSAPVHAMAARHQVSWETRVEAIRRDGDGWHLAGAPSDASRFEAVVVALPAEQAAPLLAPHAPNFADHAVRTRSAPCWTAMAAFFERIATDREVMRDAGAIGWAVRDGAKPGRGDANTRVVQATPDWSTQHLENAAEDVASALLAMLEAELGMALPPPVHLAAHRWRFARSGAKDGPGTLWDPAVRLGACGDWLLAPRVEAAWLSGRRMGETVGAG